MEASKPHGSRLWPESHGPPRPCSGRVRLTFQVFSSWGSTASNEGDLMCIPGVFLLLPAEVWFGRSQGSGVVSPGDGGTGGRATGPAGREMLSPGKGDEGVSGKPRSPFPVLGPVSCWRPPRLTWEGLLGPGRSLLSRSRQDPHYVDSARGGGGGVGGGHYPGAHHTAPSNPPLHPSNHSNHRAGGQSLVQEVSPKCAFSGAENVISKLYA